jgi:hypothetical protein
VKPRHPPSNATNDGGSLRWVIQAATAVASSSLPIARTVFALTGQLDEPAVPLQRFSPVADIKSAVRIRPTWARSPAQKPANTAQRTTGRRPATA